jgi:hypothetical protein
VWRVLGGGGGGLVYVWFYGGGVDVVGGAVNGIVCLGKVVVG